MICTACRIVQVGGIKEDKMEMSCSTCSGDRNKDGV
jgi:hypothetical protein